MKLSSANTFAQVRRQAFGGRVLLAQIGDSRLANGRGASGNDRLRVMEGIGSALAILCNGKVMAPISYNKAIAGSHLFSYVGDGGAGVRGIIPSDGSDGQLADVLALSPRPTHCLILDDTNTITRNYTVAQMTPTRQQIRASLLSAGIQPVEIVFLPKTWTADSYRRRFYALNQWIFETAADEGSIAINIAPALVDPTNANGDPTASHFYDSPAVHPGNAGAFLAAAPIAAYFNAQIGEAGFHGLSQADAYNATDNPTGNLMPKGGIFPGTAGAKSGTNVTGDVADLMQVQLVSGAVTSCVCSLEARADGGAGYWQKLVISTAGAASIWFYPQNDITVAGGSIAVGDALEFGFDLKHEAMTSNTYPGGRLLDYNVSTSLAAYYPMSWTTANGAPPAAITGRAQMDDPLVLLANTTRVLPIMGVQILGAVTDLTLRFGGASLRKVV
jgi:hypothetical protein